MNIRSKYYWKFSRIFFISRISWLESHLVEEDVDVDVVVGFVVVVVVVEVDDAVVHVDSKVVHVEIGWESIIGSSIRSISLSNNSSSETSWSVHVSSIRIPVWLRITPVLSWVFIVKENLVPIVELEKDLRS